jgi:hypothetical protein
VLDIAAAPPSGSIVFGQGAPPQYEGQVEKKATSSRR